MLDFANDTYKTVGILGGYGPFATNEFYRSILEKTNASKDWDHLHVIIDSNPRIPSRARAFLYDEESPLPYILKGIERLKQGGADFFVCPCNTAHHFIRQISDLPIPFVDMVNLTIEKILMDDIQSVGVLGSEVTTLTKIYENDLKNSDIEVINVKDLSEVREIIEAGKTNTNLESAKVLMKRLIDQFISEGAEAVIYACTELPIILPISECKIPVYDSSSLLAEQVIINASK